ncbi:curlin [Mesorhizobium sp. AR07]|uniref:curlin n=1 Tax=Mesorhizobium sp. AR07 TaxID=2865838 RepID=UPI00215E3494|nr:curlin [Mesorhizobium sp. AR07]UVK47799.1 curlin [Mesorhizobium sp. AR07]
MTLNMFKTLTAALVAGSFGQAALSAPAYAGGWVSVTFAPGNARDAGALATGLHVYSLYRGLHGASIRQLGHGNAAGIGQNGGGNLGIIQQGGNGHSATLQQNGNDNAYGIFQFGRNTDANVVQNGDGGGGATFSYGW